MRASPAALLAVVCGGLLGVLDIRTETASSQLAAGRIRVALVMSASARDRRSGGMDRMDSPRFSPSRPDNDSDRRGGFRGRDNDSDNDRRGGMRARETEGDSDRRSSQPDRSTSEKDRDGDRAETDRGRRDGDGARGSRRSDKLESTKVPDTVEGLLKVWFGSKPDPAPETQAVETKKADQQPATDTKTTGDKRSESGRASAAKSEAAKSEAAKSEAAKSEAAKSDARKSEAAKSEAAKSDARKSEAAKSEAAKSDAAKAAAAKAAAKSPTTSRAAVAKLPPIGNGTHAPGEVLAAGLSPSDVRRLQAKRFTVTHGVTLAHRGLVISRIEFPPGMDVSQAQALLASEAPEQSFAQNKYYRLYRAANSRAAASRASGIRAADADGRERCAGDRCAPRETIQWHDRIGTCSRKIRVGLIDTEIDQSHPALRSAALSSGVFIPEGRAPAPAWHGTAIVTLLAGHAQSGTPGLIPDAKFFAASAFFADEEGDQAADTLSILMALDWLQALDVQIVNMSFAGPRDELVRKAIADMQARGVVFVAAAGNDGPSAPPRYPAAYDGVIAVTAVDKDLRGYPYANRGAHIDLAAPGVGIWTAVPEQREGYYSGTSFAAPFATAVIASVMRHAKARGKADLLALLPIKDLGATGRDDVFGRGLLMAPTDCRPGGEAIATGSIGGPRKPVQTRGEAAVNSAVPAGAPLPVGFR